MKWKELADKYLAARAEVEARHLLETAAVDLAGAQRDLRAAVIHVFMGCDCPFCGDPGHINRHHAKDCPLAKAEAALKKAGLA